jgi:methionyl aminopeptidase
MIKIKTKEEIEILRKGGKILHSVLDELSQKAVIGISTKELEEIACKLILDAGGRPSFKDYKMSRKIFFPTVLCVSINEEIVHGSALPSRILKNGDIVGLDLGMEYPINKNAGNKYSKLGGYYTDSARTIIIGDVDKKTRKLVSTTKECLELAIKQIKPKNTLNDIGTAIQRHAENAGFFVVRDLVGHGVGHEVHEDPQVPNFEIKNNEMINVVLKKGMVIAIEPMLNIGTEKVKVMNDGFTIITADKSLSAHFEHTVAVTENGCEVLT